MQFVEKDAANGDDGAVASCGRASLRRAFLPGDIHTRDIPAIARAAGWRVLPEMRSLQERALQRVEQVASAADGMQEVLRLDGEVVFAQARNFLLHEGAIGRVERGEDTPVIFEMAALACAILQGQVAGALLRQQGIV